MGFTCNSCGEAVRWDPAAPLSTCSDPDCANCNDGRTGRFVHSDPAKTCANFLWVVGRRE